MGGVDAVFPLFTTQTYPVGSPPPPNRSTESAVEETRASVEADAEVQVHAPHVRVVPGGDAAAGRVADELVRDQVVVLEAPADFERADVEVDAAAEGDGRHRLAVQAAVAVHHLVVDLEVRHAESAEDVGHDVARQQ